MVTPLEGAKHKKNMQNRPCLSLWRGYLQYEYQQIPPIGHIEFIELAKSAKKMAVIVNL